MSNEQWACDLCYPGVEEIAELGPGMWLCVHNGRYFLLGGEGHNHDEAVIFAEKPISDPDPDCLLEFSDDVIRNWHKMVENFQKSIKTDPQTGHQLVECAKKQGFLSPDTDESHNFGFWCMEWCGKKVREHEQRKVSCPPQSTPI